MKLVWTFSSVKDLEEIRDFIARDSDFYAKIFIEKIIESVEKLTNFPEMGRRVEEFDDLALRELIYGNYRIIYRIKSNDIQILAILHCARKIPKGKKKLWIVE